MATINNPVFPNIETSSGGLWRDIWALTRTMKKAGWKFRASGGQYALSFTVYGPDSLPRSTIGCKQDVSAAPSAGYFYIWSSAGWQLIKYTSRTYWDFNGCTGGTGTYENNAPVVIPVSTTIAEGSSGATLPQDTIYVASTAAFPVTGKLLVYTSLGFEEVTYTGKDAGSFTGCTGGTGTLTTGNFVMGSNITNSDPQFDQLGPGGATGVSGASAIIDTPSRGRALVTGLTGITAADKGRFLVISGSGTAANNHYHQIEEYISATSVKIDARTFAVAADAGPLTWSIVDPMLDSWSESGNILNAYRLWWCAEGPAILKVPITQKPYGGTSDALRGENIKQATSGFEGELLGYVWDTVASSGYMVVSPRVRGTGAGTYGLTAGIALTGDWSGFTVDGANVDVANTKEFREQVVIWKHVNNLQGTIFLGYFDVVNDSAQMYSTLATDVNCAASSAPGSNSSVSNTFPTYGYVLRGTSTGGVGEWTGQDTNRNYQNGLVICVDAIEEQNHSADGTWTVAISDIYNHECATESWILSYHRLNDTEDGDIHPYVGLANGWHGTPYSAGNRFSWPAHSGNTPPTSTMYASCWRDSACYHPFTAWIKRGLSGERHSDCAPAMLYTFWSGWPWKLYGYIPETLATVPGNVRVRNTIWVVYFNGAARYRKGSLRWLYVVQGGQRFDTSDNKTWIQLGCGYGRYRSNSDVYGTLIHGCWDGTTNQIVM